MSDKQLLNYKFEFIQHISPELDDKGHVKEFRPQKEFAKKDLIPLNKHGDGAFCHFTIKSKWNNFAGVYTIYIDDNLVYIGQCKNLGERFNNGYGNISPKNCFQGGQSTNCKLNKIILEAINKHQVVAVYFHCTPNYVEIESELINHYHPTYNCQIPNKKSKVNNTSGGNRIHSKLESIIEFIVYRIFKVKCAKRNNCIITNSSKNTNVEKVREYLRDRIIEAKSLGFKEVILKAGDIHKELNMHQTMPTVCNAMRTLGKEFPFEIQREPPKGNGSNLIIMYKIQ